MIKVRLTLHMQSQWGRTSDAIPIKNEYFSGEGDSNSLNSFAQATCLRRAPKCQSAKPLLMQAVPRGGPTTDTPYTQLIKRRYLLLMGKTGFKEP